jgi:hypothetical protein
MTEHSTATTPSKSNETQLPRKEETAPVSPGKKGRKAGGGAGKERKNNVSFLEIRQKALEALINLSEEDGFHLSFQTADGKKDAINYWP